MHFGIDEREFQQPLSVPFVILQSSVTSPLNLFSGSFKSLLPLSLLHHFNCPSLYSFCNGTTTSFRSGGQSCTQYSRCKCMKILHNSKIMHSILTLKPFLMMAKFFYFFKTFFGFCCKLNQWIPEDCQDSHDKPKSSFLSCN